jgi:hypothetical protein
VAAISRLIRFDSGGLEPSGPLPAGRPPSIELSADDTLAVLDDAGCERAVVLSNTGGSGRHTGTSLLRRAPWSLHVAAGPRATDFKH